LGSAEARVDGEAFALDLPTSWMMATAHRDEFTGRIVRLNGMWLNMLAAVTRKDYDDRRQAQGQAKAKAEGRYRGRTEDVERNDSIALMIAAGGGRSCRPASRQGIPERAGKYL